MFLRSFVTPLVIGLLVCVELTSCNIASSSNSGSSRASKHMVGLGLHSLEELSQLRGRPLFDYVQIFIRDHPKVAGDVVEKLIELIPSDSPANVELKISFRKKIFEVIQRPSTMARDGSCSVCKLLVGLLEVLLQFYDYPAIEPTVIEYCIFLFAAIDQRILGPEICKVVLYQGPHIAVVLKENNPVLPTPPETICEFLNACFDVPSNVLMRPHGIASEEFQNHPNEFKKRERELHAYEERRLRWLDLEAAKENATVIAQLTDIHIESEYKPNTQEICGLYVCCLANQGPGNSGHYGSHYCNVPEGTMRLFLEKVKVLNPDYVIFSGDVPPHTLWDETVESQLACSHTLTKALEEVLEGHTVMPAIGNHEMFPTNLFSVKRLVNETQVMVKTFGEMWKNLAGFADQHIATMNTSGYYGKISDKHPNLRFLSINTNYMYTNNYYNTLNHNGLLPSQIEVRTMKIGIESFLSSAAAANDKVIVINHHPPGSGDYIISESKWYEALILLYKNTIVLQVAGHTHTDEFRLLKDSNNIVQSMVYTSPSIDTNGWKNPSIRLYYLDSTTYELIDYEQYYFDLEEANKNASVNPEIVQLYSAMEEYGLTDMSATSWEQLLKRFETDQSLLLKHRHHSRADQGTPATSCDESCRRQHICRQLHANYDHYTVCSAAPLADTTVATRPTLPPVIAPNTATSPLITVWALLASIIFAGSAKFIAT